MWPNSYLIILDDCHCKDCYTSYWAPFSSRISLLLLPTTLMYWYNNHEPCCLFHSRAGTISQASQANASPSSMYSMSQSKIINLCIINRLVTLVFDMAALAPLWNSCNSIQQLGQTFTSSRGRSVSFDLHLVRVF